MNKVDHRINFPGWYEKLENVRKYIIKYRKRPSSSSRDFKIRSMGTWIVNQIKNYKLKRSIMKDLDIRYEWEKMINEYPWVFEKNLMLWYKNFQDVKNYLIRFGKRPSKRNIDLKIKKMGLWIINQQKNFRAKKHIMKHERIRNSWKSLRKEFPGCFKSHIDIWYKNFEKFKHYINEHQEYPSLMDENPEIVKLGKWMKNQMQNFKNQTKTMKYKEIQNIWKKFIENVEPFKLSDVDYIIYFATHNTIK